MKLGQRKERRRREGRRESGKKRGKCKKIGMRR